MADLVGSPMDKVHTAVKFAVCFIGLISTSLILEHLQDKLWIIEYGVSKEKFNFSLFPIVCTLLMSASLSLCILIMTRGQLTPVSPVHTYAGAALSNMLAKSCMYEAVEYTSVAIRTIFSCTTMVAVMVWGLLIMQQKYNPQDYFFAGLVSAGSSIFVLYPVASATDIFSAGAEGTLLGVFILTGYLCCEGFTSCYQNVLFRGYPMSIPNQVFCVSMLSFFVSLSGVVLQNNLVPAVLFLVKNPQCLSDILLIAFVGTGTQFFAAFTIKTYGARTFSLVFTLRQLVGILISCVWSTQPLSWLQWLGAVIVVLAILLDNVYGTQEQPVVPADQENVRNDDPENVRNDDPEIVRNDPEDDRKDDDVLEPPEA